MNFFAKILVFLFLCNSAHASLVTNGDFETGDFTNWAKYTNPPYGTIGDGPGLIGTGVVLFDTAGTGSASNSGRFIVGNDGGGIEQTFLSDAGVFDIALDWAVASGGNVMCNCNTRVYIDDILIDSGFIGLPGFRETVRQSLGGQIGLEAGSHTLRIDMDRQFGATNAQIHYLDNISVTTVVPIPAAAWLFGSALAGLGWLKRKQTI